MKRSLIILAGPTATGKTAVSIELAKQINGAVISADSMQVYRGMDIGSAKVMPEEMDGIDHYLIDVLDPKDEFHVVAFQQLAKEAMEKIYEKEQIPIITGGTGFYIQAVLYDIDFGVTEDDDSIRENFEEYAEQYGNAALHALLQKADPVAAEAIHPNNRKRVIRALEYYEGTGERISAHNKAERAKESPYLFEYFVLTDDRARLYKRINERVEKMMEKGLEAEVRGLVENGCTEDLGSMKGIGYREFFPYFREEITLPQVMENIKKDTRHFAKRQLTWFRRERDVRWIDISEHKRDPKRIAAYIAEHAKKDGLI